MYINFHVLVGTYKRHLLTPWSRVLREKLISSQLVMNLPAFMEPEGLLPHLGVPATCPYPGADQSSS
jgi:hypothetical protein